MRAMLPIHGWAGRIVLFGFAVVGIGLHISAGGPDAWLRNLTLLLVTALVITTLLRIAALIVALVGVLVCHNSPYL